MSNISQSLWDNQVQNCANDGLAEIPWDAFFQSGRPGA